MGSPVKRLLASCAVACLAVLSFASASAAMTVNTTNDETTSGDAACSLREAIVSATSNTIGGDCSRASGDNTVTLPADHYVLSPTLGELLFAAGPTVTINGANPSDPSQTWIDAAATPAVPYRVMEILGGATLKNLKVSGGLSASGVAGASPGQPGTPGANGGGILNNNNGALTLDHVIVTDNFTGGGGRGANSAGDGTTPGSGNRGGAGGGIYSGTNAFLSITASTITGNGTGNGGAGGDAGAGVNCLGHFPDGATGGAGAYSGSGGGIYNLGSATITTTTVSENFTGTGGVGGNGGNGAGWESCPTPGGPLVFNAGTGGLGGRGGNGSWGVDPNLGANFQYLTREGGGGIASFGTLTMSASTISGNNTGAGGTGGGSGLPGQKQDGTFRSAGPGGDGGSAGIGGGLFVDGNTAQANLTNVTLAGNFTGNGGTGGAGYSGTAGLGGGRGGYGGFGGGIWSTGANNTGNPVLLKQVTISQNGLGAAGAGGANSGTPRPGLRGQGAGVAVGGRSNPSSGAYGVGFQNTLVASNGVAGTDLNCIQYYDPSQYVDLFDLGHNISYPDNSCPGTNGNPLLGPLQNNGGPTFTMVPATGSSAINAVPAGSCTVNVDQRGVTRPGPSKSACDAGAVETGLTNPTSLTVSKSGTGAGTVTSSPGGISCGSTCSALYEQGQVVTLTATPTAGSSFTGWSGGGCSGTSTCQVTLNSATSVTASFADIAAPQTTITGGPVDGSTTNDSTPTFTFSSSESGSTFECSIDSAAFTACSSPGPGSTGSHTPATALSDGSHTFAVRARDAASNVDTSPDSRTFTVDTTPPPSGGGGGGGGAPTPPPPAGPTGKRAAALKKCKKKKGQARANCIKKAKKLPV